MFGVYGSGYCSKGYSDTLCRKGKFSKSKLILEKVPFSSSKKIEKEFFYEKDWARNELIKPKMVKKILSQKTTLHKQNVLLFFVDSGSKECFSFHSFFLVFLGKIAELPFNFLHVILIRVVSIEHNTIPMPSIASVY